MENVITYVGIDAHKKDLFLARLVGDQTTPVTWQVANESNAVRRFVRKLEREAPGPVRMCYEAGPGGYALPRQVTTPRVHARSSRRRWSRGSLASGSRPIAATPGHWWNCCARGC